MNRSFFTDAIVLSSRLSGEDNRTITFLSPERGVFNAVLYGGRKNKLRSMVSLFHSGKGWFYNDETRHSIKITDFDATSFRPTLREDLYKSCAASFMSELVIKTNGSTESDELQRLWVLVNGFLDGLDLSSNEDAHLGLLRFIWRYLGFMGLQPDPVYCDGCGSPLGNSGFDTDEKNGNIPKSIISCYDESRHGFLCHDCHEGLQEKHILSQEAMNYLIAMTTLSPSQVRQFTVHAATFQQLHDLMFRLITTETGMKFRTLEASQGIL